MITTTYSCDRKGCGHWQTDADKPRRMIRIEVEAHVFQEETYKVAREALWCEECATEAHLPFDGGSAFEARPEEPITLEDLVRKIVHEETEQ